MSSVNDVRSTFLDYFHDNDHAIVPSGSLVPHNDPTLMFTAAGMVPFKNVFTGLEKRPYSRAVTAQKCLRAGGKHNDLDNVGYTARHHTFFEMLGNFSFGDYFKERAVELAWTLITKEFGLSKDKLVVTVFHEDDEAASLWKRIAGLPDDRIIRIATSDNFWTMGETGPCGPCSEIFYDHGASIPGGPPGSPDEDGDRFVEIWNLVFMQYEQVSRDNRQSLPRPSIDTGMGLERMAAVMQGVHDNYEIDLFRRLIEASQQATGTNSNGANRASHRVIADHLRASSFLIADGVLPSNEGRGYVLRRIMRRAMRHVQLLGAKDPVMHRLVPTLTAEMGTAYPELLRAEELITETLRLEETRFLKTLERGMALLDEASGDLSQGDQLPGETAFRLYDTYGFPLDLTQDALRQRGIGVDEEGFAAAMERQRAEARAHWAGSGDTGEDKIWFSIRDRTGATEFLGYDRDSAEAEILAIVVDGKEVDEAGTGSEIAFVTNQTPFYAESGGQIGDRGQALGTGLRVDITDTKKRGDGLNVHFGRIAEGSLRRGDAVRLAIDGTRRSLLRSNHSATHLLHEALREVLGTHVAQKGSLVSDGRLRFDFSHSVPMSDEEIAEVEELANRIIAQNAPVTTRLMSVDDAIAEGAMALFGEKYGDEVRVVSMGQELASSEEPKAYSTELCGGTHVRRTGDIGLIRIISESAVSSGVRRIEALVGSAARQYLDAQERRLKSIASALKVPVAQAEERVQSLIEERRRLERDLADARKRLAMGAGDKGSAGAAAPTEVNGLNFVGRVLDGVSPRELKGLVDESKSVLKSGVVLLVGRSEEGKAALVAGVTDDLTETVSAVDLVRAAVEPIGGKGGGGRADFAQAGGPDGARAEDAIAAGRAFLEALSL